MKFQLRKKFHYSRKFSGMFFNHWMTSYLLYIVLNSVLFWGLKDNLEVFTHILLWSVDAPCRMCLNGGEDVHNTLLSSICDLADLFSCYSDEVLVRSCLIPLKY